MRTALAILLLGCCLSASAQTTNFWLCWTNPPFAGATNWVTGVEASGDLRRWTRILLVPYAKTNCYKLIGYREHQQFYRVYNRQKPTTTPN